jgi:hypothetical protein
MEMNIFKDLKGPKTLADSVQPNHSNPPNTAEVSLAVFSPPFNFE